jgi:hypothetical protein
LQQQQQQQRRRRRSSSGVEETEDQKRLLVQLVAQHNKDWQMIGPVLGKTPRQVRRGG